MTGAGIHRLKPFSIPTLRDEWLAAIFGRFDEVARSAAQPLMGDPHWARQAKALFFQSLADRFDADRYGGIQATHLRADCVGLDGNRLKYFDTPTWAGGKFDHALRLGLHKSPPLRILDLGAGPGHFQVVAEYFGHETFGLDVPLRAASTGQPRHLYDDLCEFFALRKMDHRIVAGQSLPALPGRFDLVTSFMTCFSTDPSTSKPWTVENWSFLLRDLRDHVLSGAGMIYLNLTPGVYDERSWEFLKSVGGRIIEKSRTLAIAQENLGAI